MIRDLKSKGLSNIQIAQELGIDRKTVSKWLSTNQIPTYQKQVALPSKLDPFKSYILTRMNEGCVNANIIFDEITVLGYQGKSTILRTFMQPLRQSAMSKASIRYETPPGKQAQVDWGEFKLVCQDGSFKRVHAFVMILGYSRTKYVEFTEDEKIDTLIGCHERAFQFFGGVAETILYDNMRTVVKHSHEKGENKWNDKFLRFAKHYNFNPLRCRPYHPQSKGKVENGVKYLRINFWPRLKTVTGLADLNTQVKLWLDTTCNVRLHRTTRKVPLEELKLEVLRPINPDLFLLTDLQSRKVAKDCVISFESNYYSVPFRYCGHRIGVKDLKNGTIAIYDELGNLIANHIKGTQKHQYLKNKKHFEGLISWSQKNVATTAPILIPDQTLKVHQRPLAVYDSIVNEVIV